MELRQRDQNMGLATVYRALESLKLQGAVQVRTLATGESLYSSVQQDQHHLTCIHCGRSIVFNECPVHELEEKLEKSHQFKVYYHTLEFFWTLRSLSTQLSVVCTTFKLLIGKILVQMIGLATPGPS